MIFKRHLLFSLLMFTFIAILFYKLTSMPKPLYDWDESLYVQNGIEMLENNSFLVPIWQGQEWLDKPPLTPLLLGIVAKYIPLPVEISTRLYTLFLSVVALTLLYALYLKACKNQLVAALTTVITATSTIFLQRTQVVSLDVTLLIGWLGFFLFLEKPVITTFFLFLSVQSKSLLGFYPLGIYAIYLSYLLIIKKLKYKTFKKNIQIILMQILVLSIWYLIAFGLYKEQFFQQHIIESHFRRVSASLESHFGQRTFYLDLIQEQLGLLFILSVIGFFMSVYSFIKKKISVQTFLLQNAFLPWFLFLNITKTKISWYLYPVIGQFAFYASYTITLIKNKKLQIMVFLLIGFMVIYQNLYKQNLFTTFYSQEDSHIQASKYAKSKCTNLAVLVPTYTRDTYQTLQKMDLTISTTNWWGEHPAMVYYFAKPLKFFYSTEKFKQNIDNYQCFIIDIQDKNTTKQSTKKLIKAFDKMLLYK